jgi:DNA-binding LytR/AlgR family response regulator
MIIDDEPGAISNLEILLRNHPDIVVISTTSHPETAVEFILDKRPDLLFLDIQMPGMTGFEVAKAIAEEGFHPTIIFVTGHDQFAKEAIRHSAFDFLDKPVTREELHRAMERFRENKQDVPAREKYMRLIERSKAPQRLKINTAGGFTLIDPEEIIYIEADWNYAEIFMGGGKSELCSVNIGSLELLLSQDCFFRVSRSLIINTKYLTKVNRKKHEAFLVKQQEAFTFSIPLLNIRKLERFLENLQP